MNILECKEFDKKLARKKKVAWNSFDAGEIRHKGRSDGRWQFIWGKRYKQSNNQKHTNTTLCWSTAKINTTKPNKKSSLLIMNELGQIRADGHGPGR